MLWHGFLTGIVAIVATVTIGVAVGSIVIVWMNRKID